MAIAMSSIACISAGTIFFYFFLSAHCLFGGNYYHESSSPLHDAVVLYYQDKKKEAKRLLLAAANDKKYTGGAYINYAMLLESENYYQEAEEYYRKALQSGEHIALLYLFMMYAKQQKDSPPHVITAAGNLSQIEGSYWVEYRKAEEKLLRNDVDGAIQYFEKAVNLGLPDLQILHVDPLFNQLKNDPRFQALLTKARTNYRKYRQIEKALEEEVIQFYKESPYGALKNLYRILNDIKRDDAKTEKALRELLHTEQGARERGIALYILARIRARNKDKEGAAKHMASFKELIASDKNDRTGFVALVKKIGEDLFANDPFLKEIK